MAVVSGENNHTPSIPGHLQQGRKLPQPLSRPGQVQLITPRELRIHGVVDDSDHTATRIGDGYLNLCTQLRAGSKLHLVEQSGGPPGPRYRNEAGMSRKAGTLHVL